MFSNEWWLWGPREKTQITEKDFYDDEDAYARFIEEQERKYYDKFSEI